MIEIASALAASPVHPKRSILFMAFFGEEKGLLGSRYYTSHPLVPLEKTMAPVNLEQVGRTDSTDGPQIDVAYVTGFDYSNLAKILAAEAPLAGVKIAKDPTEKYFERSDNLYFAQAGVPAHTVYVAADFSDYHRVGDEWQKINYANMAQVDRAIALGLLRLASEAPAPAWNSPIRPPADTRRRPRNCTKSASIVLPSSHLLPKRGLDLALGLFEHPVGFVPDLFHFFRMLPCLQRQ